MSPSDKKIEALVHKGYTIQFKYGDMMDLNIQPFTGYRVKISKDRFGGWHGFGSTWKKALAQAFKKVDYEIRPPSTKIPHNTAADR